MRVTLAAMSTRREFPGLRASQLERDHARAALAEKLTEVIWSSFVVAKRFEAPPGRV
jgi:hypothetical protein